MANKFLRDDFDIAKRFGYHGVPTFDWDDYVLTEGDDDKSIIFGFELELGCTQEVTTEMYKELVKMFPVIFESDSSIMGNRTSSDYIYGTEMITQPMSKNWFYAHLDDWKKTIQYLNDNGFGSYDVGSCGLHIHFAKPDTKEELDRTIARLWLIQQTYKDQIRKIDGRSWTEYAQDIKENARYDIIEETLSTEWLLTSAKETTGMHCLAINLQHPNDIEIRSPKGTINFESFMAKLEFWTNAYVEAGKDQRISRLTWNKLVKGEYISAYCVKKDISTLKIMEDTTNEIQHYFEKIYKYNLTINKLALEFLEWSSKQNVPRVVKKQLSEYCNVSCNFSRPISYNSIADVYRVAKSPASRFYFAHDKLKELIENLDKLPKPLRRSEIIEKEV